MCCSLHTSLCLSLFVFLRFSVSSLASPLTCLLHLSLSSPTYSLPPTLSTDTHSPSNRYTGVSETIRIRRDGYPVRLDFAEFVTRYQMIAFPATREIPPVDHAAACVKILGEAPSKVSCAGRAGPRQSKTQTKQERWRGCGGGCRW
jgi:hypothetical protein